MSKFSKGDCHLQKKGFTLTEVLIVISIIVILIGISVPVLIKYQPSLQLSSSVRDLITDLRYSQQLTVTEQIEHCICFFPLDGEYEKRYQIIRCGESDPQCGEPDPVLVKEKSLPEKIKTLTISDSFINDEVRYNPYGAVKTAGTVTLTDTKDETKTIEVKPSGFVKTK